MDEHPKNGLLGDGDAVSGMAAFRKAYERAAWASVLWCLSVDQHQAAALALDGEDVPTAHVVAERLSSLSGQELEVEDRDALETLFAPLRKSVIEPNNGDVPTKSLLTALCRPGALGDDTLKFIRGFSDTPRLAFGIWRPGSAFLGRPDDKTTWQPWHPEFSLKAVYEPQSFDSFLRNIAEYAATFHQSAMLVDLHQSSTVDTWVLSSPNWASPPESFSYENKGETLEWICHCLNASVKWGGQFKQILHAMSFEKANPRWDDTQGARRRHLDRTGNKNIESDFGAQFLPGEGQRLRVRIAGDPGLMFESFLLPVLIADARTAKQSNLHRLLLNSDRQLAILMDPRRDVAGSSRAEVMYAFLADDPGRSLRCLCGEKYPSHEGVNVANVVPLRLSRDTWIRGEYAKKSRAYGTSWGLASSPHFFLLGYTVAGRQLSSLEEVGHFWRDHVLPALQPGRS